MIDYIQPNKSNIARQARGIFGIILHVSEIIVILLYTHLKCQCIKKYIKKNNNKKRKNYVTPHQKSQNRRIGAPKMKIQQPNVSTVIYLIAFLPFEKAFLPLLCTLCISLSNEIEFGSSRVAQHHVQNCCLFCSQAETKKKLRSTAMNQKSRIQVSIQKILKLKWIFTTVNKNIAISKTW